MSPRSNTDLPLEESRPRRGRRQRRKPETPAPTTADEPLTKSPRKRWPWILLSLGLFVFFLPNLIGWVGIQQIAIDYGLADFNGKVSVESVSLGWFQPIKLTNVNAVDALGNPIAQIPDVTSSKSLFSILTGDDYGQFNVQTPVVFLKLRPDGSNVEDAIAKYIQPAGEPSTQPNTSTQGEPPTRLPKLSVNIVEGKVVVSATTTNKSWQIDGLNATVQLSTEAAPLVIDANCRVTPGVLNENGQTILLDAGGVAISGQVDAGSELLSFGSANVTMETQNLPLSLVAPVLQRFVGPSNTEGQLNGKIQAAYDAQSNSAEVAIERLTMTGVEIEAPGLIGSDQLTIEHVTAHGMLQFSPTVIAAQQFIVQSVVGKVTADGTFDLSQITNLAKSGQLLDTPFRMDGEIDLARLIRMLPSTLQLHQDLEVQSGTIRFFANSRNENGDRRLVLNLDTANLKARRGRQHIAWAKPLRLVATIHQSSGQLALEDVRCESDFLTIIGNANMQTASFVAEGDLAKLMENVGQFVDLEGMRLAGILKGSFGWQVGSTNSNSNAMTGIANLPIQIGGSFSVVNPVAEFPGMQPWQQPQMSIKVSASGRLQSENSLQLDQGGIQVDIGGEQLVATLAEPVADALTNRVWYANCQMTGTMAGWLGHIENFVDLGEITANGNLSLKCSASVDSKSIQLSNIHYEIEQLAFDGFGMKIRESNAVGAGVLMYDLASGNTTIAETTLSASSISARGNQLKISYPGNLRVDGQIVFQGDVNRIAEWFELSPTQESVYWFGIMDGTVQLVSNEHGIGGHVNSTITDLIAAKQTKIESPPIPPGQIVQASQPKNGWQEIWREPIVAISGNISLANDFDSIEFKNLLLDASGLKVRASGSVSDLANSMLTDLAGTWSPNWEKINSVLQAYTGNLLRFAGQGEEQFALKGPIFEVSLQPGQPEPWVPPSLQATASFGWDRGEIFNLPVGASQMQLDLGQSVAVVKTTGIPFAGGMVMFAPKIDLRSREPMLTMDWTRLIDNVALEPETARQWLRYIAPLAADATSAQGNFTVDIGGARIPLFDPMNMEAHGAIKLHSVVIGSGPAAEQLLATVQQLRAVLKPESAGRDLSTWLRISEQTVPIAVKNGRVYHDQLDFSHNDLVIQTQGSVGFDQTLDLIAEIPIADDWIAGKPYLASLRGRSISIPVTGTVSQPRLDKRALQQLSGNLVKQGINGAVNQAIADKLAPKIDEYQNRFNDKFNNELDKLQGKLGGELKPNVNPATNQPHANNPSLEDQVGKKLEDAWNKGIGNLFGK